MVQFLWHDGTVKNIHVDPPFLYEYQVSDGSGQSEEGGMGSGDGRRAPCKPLTAGASGTFSTPAPGRDLEALKFKA